jgi:hypothetical protein
VCRGTLGVYHLLRAYRLPSTTSYAHSDTHTLAPELRQAHTGSADPRTAPFMLKVQRQHSRGLSGSWAPARRWGPSLQLSGARCWLNFAALKPRIENPLAR